MTPIPATDRHITTDGHDLMVWTNGDTITICMQDHTTWDTRCLTLTDWRDVRALYEMISPRMHLMREMAKQQQHDRRTA